MHHHLKVFVEIRNLLGQLSEIGLVVAQMTLFECGAKTVACVLHAQHAFSKTRMTECKRLAIFVAFHHWYKTRLQQLK